MKYSGWEPNVYGIWLMVDGLQARIRTRDPSTINHIPYTINTISLLIHHRQRRLRLRLHGISIFISRLIVAVDYIKNGRTNKDGKE